MVLDILEDLFERDEKEDKPGRKHGKDAKEKRGLFDRISELLD